MLVLHLQIGAAARLVLWLLVAASLVHVVLRHVLLRTPNAIVRGAIVDASQGHLTRRDGSSFDARVLGTTYVSPVLTVLNLRVPNSRLARHVLLVPDNVHADDFRNLRVVLNWARSSDAPATTPRGDSAP